MKIVVLAVGQIKTDYISRGIEIYKRRLEHYVDFELIDVPDIKNTKSLTQQRQKELEGEAIAKVLSAGDVILLMDEHGKEYTSREFSEMISKRMLSGIKRLVLVIGGPYGFSDDTYNRATGKVSLSKLTFPHEMARLIVVEQLYRAFTILKGEPYHHD
ncbi:MAG: 23S rRNA (pseudouridine(1915)-N(3))-methyltransferase RlmH [Paramuribaculum sp.]|nr:23S rRNA (pseudouridine(1915)-N(3))-methyltransferase RlmH [Paramuribaculum sp.]